MLTANAVWLLLIVAVVVIVLDALDRRKRWR
jgi:hypothetical protein